MWRVVVGANRLSQLGPEVEVRNIKRLLMHEYYRGIKSGHDIALLELDKPVQCSQYIQLACVPDASLKVMDLSDCYVSGWGSTEQRCEFPKTVVQSESLACWGDRGWASLMAEAQSRVKPWGSTPTERWA